MQAHPPERARSNARSIAVLLLSMAASIARELSARDRPPQLAEHLAPAAVNPVEFQTDPPPNVLLMEEFDCDFRRSFLDSLANFVDSARLPIRVNVYDNVASRTAHLILCLQPLYGLLQDMTALWALKLDNIGIRHRRMS